MSQQLIVVNTVAYDIFVNGLSLAPRRINRVGIRYMRKLTKRGTGWMRFFTAARTRRATGKLNKNVNSYIRQSLGGLSGRIYIKQNKDTKHAWATDQGFSSSSFTIRATGRFMRVKASDWKRASSSVSIQQMGSGGVFFFETVKRGKYKGKHFVDKTVQKIEALHSASKNSIALQIGRAI